MAILFGGYDADGGSTANVLRVSIAGGDSFWGLRNFLFVGAVVVLVSIAGGDSFWGLQSSRTLAATDGEFQSQVAILFGGYIP